VYEKTVNRRSNSCFDPKATLQKLKQGSPASVLDENARRALIEQYLDFKQLMLKFDPDDPDDDDTNAAPPKVTIKLGGDDVRPSEPSDGAGDRNVPDKAKQNTQHEQQKDVPQKVPKLTIVPPRPPEVKETRHHRSHKSHKPERHKKHRHKKKRKKMDDSEDSANEYSDPEVLV